MYELHRRHIRDARLGLLRSSSSDSISDNSGIGFASGGTAPGFVVIALKWEIAAMDVLAKNKAILKYPK